MLKTLVNNLAAYKRSLYAKSVKRKIHSVGCNFHVRKEFRIHNGQYISIGDNFNGMPGCRIEAWDEYEGERFNPTITIGDNVSMNFDCHIGAIQKVVIGNGVLFGSRVFISDHNHGRVTEEEKDIPPNKRKLHSKGSVIIEDNVWIGEGVVILPNVTVGKGSIIGANAVVTKDIVPYSVVGGNPAKVIRQL